MNALRNGSNLLFYTSSLLAQKPILELVDYHLKQHQKHWVIMICNNK